MITSFFFEKKLINQDMADNLLTWRHSGFSERVTNLWESRRRSSLETYSAKRGLRFWEQATRLKGPKPGLYVCDFGQNFSGWCPPRSIIALHTPIELVSTWYYRFVAESEMELLPE